MQIQITNLKKSYKNHKVLRDISLTLNQGEIIGLLGANGAGKSTLMKILSGVITEWEGEIWVNNSLNLKTNRSKIQSMIGYMPEDNPLYTNMYVKEYLSFVAKIHKITPNFSSLLEEIGLIGYEHKKIKTLSKGYKQRVGLAATLIHNPEFIILDEPTNGLDPTQLVQIRNMIKALGKTKIILLSTHILEEIKAICDRVIILDNGKIIEHSTTAKETELEQYFNPI